MDDRNWNQKFTKPPKVKKTKVDIVEGRKLDKELIENHSILLRYRDRGTDKEEWLITMETKYGHTDCIYYPKTRRWKKKIGKAKGITANSIIKYFKPRRVNG